MRAGLEAPPRLADPIERERVDLHLDLPGGCGLRQARVRLPLDVLGRAEVGVPHDRQQLAPDRGRGDRRLRARAGTELDDARAKAGRVNRRRERPPEQRVEDDIDAPFGGIGERAGERIGVLLEVDGGVGAKREAAIEALLRARGGDHAPCAEQLRGLDGDLAEHAAGGEHEHMLAVLAAALAR